MGCILGKNQKEVSSPKAPSRRVFRLLGPRGPGHRAQGGREPGRGAPRALHGVNSDASGEGNTRGGSPGPLTWQEGTRCPRSEGPSLNGSPRGTFQRMSGCHHRFHGCGHARRRDGQGDQELEGSGRDVVRKERVDGAQLRSSPTQGLGPMPCGHMCCALTAGMYGRKRNGRKYWPTPDPKGKSGNAKRSPIFEPLVGPRCGQGCVRPQQAPAGRRGSVAGRPPLNQRWWLGARSGRTRGLLARPPRGGILPHPWCFSPSPSPSSPRSIKTYLKKSPLAQGPAGASLVAGRGGEGRRRGGLGVAFPRPRLRGSLAQGES